MWPYNCKLIFVLRLFSLSLEHPVWFPLAHHLLAIGIESVIDDPLGRIEFVVVLEAQVPKAFSNSFKPCAFGLIPERIIGIRSINNFSEQYQCSAAGKIVFFQYCFERTLVAVVSQFHAFDVEWGGIDPLGFVGDLVGRHKVRSEEHTSELQSPDHLVCPLLLEKK